MKKNENAVPAWLTAAVCLVFAALGYLQFLGLGSKHITLAAGLGVIALLALGELKRLCNLPSLLLLGHVLFSCLTALWAMSGKFHLRESSKLLVAAAVFLLLVLRGRNERAFLRRVAGVIAGVCALYAFASVAAAASDVCRALLQRLPGANALSMEFGGSRLSGVLGNSNIEASLYAVGIFLSLALLCEGGRRWERVLFAATLSFNAFAFLLVFSMGAIACFAAAVLMYLLAAGERRGAVLVRMLAGAIPALASAFAAARLFGSAAPVLLLLGCAAVTAALELTVVPRLAETLTAHSRLVFGVIGAVLVLGAAYIALGLRVTGASYTFGDYLSRSTALSPGEHTLCVTADGAVDVEINSQTELEIMSMKNTVLYGGECDGTITFTVPEQSRVCGLYFTAPEGTVMQSAVLDGGQSLPLKYKLLPDFVGNRVQNLSNSTSVVQRRIFMQDGLKLFRLSPIVGNGVGAFETGITAVQDFHYETKYVHNHYVQILLEDGVIGFALFAAALVSLAAALWRKRKGEGGWLYGALCAEFVMNGAQMCWDVSMSAGVFTAMTYAVYALIVLTCAEPLKKTAEAPKAAPKKKKQEAKKPTVSVPRIAAVAAAGAVVLTLCGNLYADRVVNAPVASMDAFFRNIERALPFDLYEYNDRKLSYVVTAAREMNHIEQANVYAQELGREQSNTIPRYLVSYYLQTEQYEAAIDAAMRGASFSATDDETWNRCAGMLRSAFFESGEASPLLHDDGTLARKLQEYSAMLRAHNAAALLPVEPDEAARDFFARVDALTVK